MASLMPGHRATIVLPLHACTFTAIRSRPQPNKTDPDSQQCPGSCAMPTGPRPYVGKGSRKVLRSVNES